MRKLILPAVLLTAVFAMAGRAMASAESVADVQATSGTGTLVTLAYAPGDPYEANTSDPIVSGVLSVVGTVAGHSYTNWSFLVNDGSGGMDLFGHMPASNPSYVPKLGDTIQVNGTYSPFDGIPEVATLTSLTKTGTAPVPAPVTATVSYLLSDIASNSQPGPITPNDVAGMMVTVLSPTISGFSAFSPSYSSGNLTGVLSDPSGGTMTIFNWVTSYDVPVMTLGGYSTSGLTSITGFVDLFGTNPEFVPISATGLTLPVPEPGTFALLGTGLAIAAVRWVRRKNRKQSKRIVGVDSGPRLRRSFRI
jgi:hypothetical protein